MSDSQEKRANFRRLAESRTQSVLEALRKLSNLSSPNYEFEETEVERIFAAIQGAVDAAHERFKPRQKGGKFSLSSGQ